jgi:L-alanine-DL-glutamate epimerase-like enolase superfamily enzyme
MRTEITSIERYPLKVPFREVPGRNLRRELPHWRYVEVLECTLADGSVGFGETTLFYSWGDTTQSDVDRVVGENAVAHCWDDDIGPGLQIAMFDAVGRSLGVPVHRLLGDPVRDRVPVSWWCIDMPPEDWVAEAERAHEAGYTSLKVKGRPWFDLREQIGALEDALPPSFDVDIDFNGTMLEAERALPILRELESSPLVSHFEDPLARDDLEGHRRLRDELDTPIVSHYGKVDPADVVATGAVDGWVLTGGADALRDAGGVAEVHDMPVWLQLIGTGITAAFTRHVGSVVDAAEWPAITGHQIYSDSLLSDPLPVADGTAPVPTDPGLGVDIDRSALERFRTERPSERPNPPRLIEASWPDGRRLYFAGDVDVMFKYAAQSGTDMPYFEAGATARLVEDDGSDAWQRLYERAQNDPVVIGPDDADPLA